MGSGASGRGERGEELLALAGAALGRGDWAGARDAYRQVLEGGESAAVLEGLAYACWWLQEDATTVDCRRRAFRLYLDADDKVSAARVAISLARDRILRGEHSVANGWVGRARRLLAEAGPVAEAGWLGIVRTHIALYADRDPPQARRLAGEAVAVGRAVGSRDVEMQARAYEGLALVSEGLVAEACASWTSRARPRSPASSAGWTRPGPSPAASSRPASGCATSGARPSGASG
jgi:hypothetical protein